MTRTIAYAILLASTAGFALAGTAPAPEIDAAAAPAAIGLLAGAILVLRARSRRNKTQE